MTKGVSIMKTQNNEIIIKLTDLFFCQKSVLFSSFVGIYVSGINANPPFWFRMNERLYAHTLCPIKIKYHSHSKDKTISF